MANGIAVPVLDVDSAVMGDRIAIHLEGKGTNNTCTLSYSLGGSSGEITTTNRSTFYWLIPDLVSKIPGKREAVCTITCTTMYGDAVLGKETTEFTLVVPDASHPTASAAWVKMGGHIYIDTNRNSNAYIHTISYSFGDTAGIIATGVEERCSWKPEKSLAAQLGQKSGLCTIICDTYNGSLLIGTQNVQIDLYVPDATVPTLSATEAELGGTITISMPAGAEAFTHSLTYEVREQGAEEVAGTGEIAGDCEEEYLWEIPYVIAALVPSEVVADVTVLCNTWIGTDLVGTESVSFVANVPCNDVTKPKATLTVKPENTPFNGLYVAGCSVAASCEAVSDFSNITTRYIKIDVGASYDGELTQFIRTPGEVEIFCRVTDARGFSSDATETITVIDYSGPRIIPGGGESKIVCTRCNSDGTTDPAGVYLRLQFGRKYSKVLADGVQHNFCALSYQWKTAEAEEFYAPVELLAKEAGTDYVDVVLPNVASSIAMAYNIRLIAEDDVGISDVVTVTIPTAFATYHSPIGGHGFTLGNHHDPNKVDVFDCYFDAQFQKTTAFYGDVSGMVLGLGALPQIPDWEDVDDYTLPGVYGVYDHNNAGKIYNLPTEKDGTLRVWSGNGLAYKENGYVAMQEFIPDDNSASYRRSLRWNSLNGYWEKDPWKTHVWQEM